MINSLNVGLNVSRQLPEDIEVGFVIDHTPLFLHGFNIPLIVQTPSVLCTPPISRTPKSIMVMAHFDTGATRTSIASEIAQALELETTGYSNTHTAAGLTTFPDYTVDILFLNGTLKEL